MIMPSVPEARKPAIVEAREPVHVTQSATFSPLELKPL